MIVWCDHRTSKSNDEQQPEMIRGARICPRTGKNAQPIFGQITFTLVVGRTIWNAHTFGQTRLHASRCDAMRCTFSSPVSVNGRTSPNVFWCVCLSECCTLRVIRMHIIHVWFRACADAPPLNQYVDFGRLRFRCDSGGHGQRIAHAIGGAFFCVCVWSRIIGKAESE